MEREVLSNASGQHGLECPMQIYDARICGWNRHIQYELESIVAIPSHPMVVGNVTTIMATTFLLKLIFVEAYDNIV